MLHGLVDGKGRKGLWRAHVVGCSNLTAEEMEYKGADKVIGYSGLDLLEECYGYNENACYIGDTRTKQNP